MNEGDAWFPAGVTRLLAETFVHGAEGGGPEERASRCCRTSGQQKGLPD